MKITWTRRNLVVEANDLSIDAIPSLRLVAAHAPRQRIEVKTGSRTFLVEIGDLDLDYYRLCA